MRSRCFSAAIVTLLLCSSVALAHTQLIKGTLRLTITGINGGVVSVDVSGRLRSFRTTTGSGELTLDNIGRFAGVATLVDPDGDQLFMTFKGTIHRDDTYTATFLVTGGTGKWNHNVGNGTMNGVVGDASMVAFLDGSVTH